MTRPTPYDMHTQRGENGLCVVFTAAHGTHARRSRAVCLF